MEDSKNDSHSDSDFEQPNESDEYLEQVPKFDRAVEYMETEKGHEVTLRIVAMLEQLAPVLKQLLEAKTKEQINRPKLEFWKWLVLLIVRLLVFAVAVWALIYMRQAGNIDPAIALLTAV